MYRSREIAEVGWLRHRADPIGVLHSENRVLLLDAMCVCVLLKFKLLGGSGAFSIMQIRLKQPSSLHRPLVHRDLDDFLILHQRSFPLGER